MQRFLDVMPPDTGLVVNFIFTRKAIKNGGLPAITDVPAGSRVLLGIEPAVDDSVPPLTPGVRIKEELWELGYALDYCAENNLRPVLYVDPDFLKTTQLIETPKGLVQFLENTAAIVAATDSTPTEISTYDLNLHAALKRGWPTLTDGNGADVSFIGEYVGFNNGGEFPTGRNGRRHGRSRYFDVDSLILRLPHDTMIKDDRREGVLKQSAAAFERAESFFGIKRRAVLVDIRTLVGKPDTPAHE